MSGIGPIEPGEGTHAWDTHPAEPPAVTPAAPGTPPPRLRRLLKDRRRAALAALLAVGLLTLCAQLYATRPQEREPAVSRPPFPAQVVDVTYLGEHSGPPGTRPHTFAFEVLLSVDSGPPVTVTRVSQPYAGASLTSAPRAPFRTEAGSARKIVITLNVADCGTVPENAGLPFIDVTLRNTRAIQQQSFILGPRYAHDLSRALEVACSNESP